ncbi:MAG: hypothetical protein ACRD44_19260 [Bryobacteraceae bacterium]
MFKTARFAVLAMACILMLAGTTVFGQDPAPQPPAGADDPKKVQTFTGCLSQGTDGTFMLKTKGQSEQVTVAGAELGKHVGHTVQLTGWMKTEGGKNIFQVTQIKHIATTCE